MDTLICVRCGEKAVRTGKNQKYCRDCVKSAYRELNRLSRRRTRRMNRKPVVGEKNTEPLCQWKPDTRGIGECPRWKECEYGADEEDIRLGTCKYNEKTGFCKVVVIDGKRTVEPTKNCCFFKPKEEADDDACK